MKKAKKKYPVPPDKFNEEIRKSKEQGKLTERAGHYILILVTNLQDKNTKMKYDSIDIKNDVKSVAIKVICEKWFKFNTNVSNNAFSYFTSIAMNGLFEGMNIHTKSKENVHYNYDRYFDESV